jgi:hypothetical protein
MKVRSVDFNSDMNVCEEGAGGVNGFDSVAPDPSETWISAFVDVVSYHPDTSLLSDLLVNDV